MRQLGRCFFRIAFCLAFWISCTLVAVRPASAQNDTTLCFSRGTDSWQDETTYKPALAACNREINSGRHRGHALAQYYLARAYWYDRSDNPDGALQDYNRAIKVDTNNAETYYFRADYFMRKKDFDRAIADYTQSVRIESNFAPGYYMRGYSYEMTNRRDLAMDDYRRAAATSATDNRLREWGREMASKRLADLAANPKSR